jgi:hypothetical protein
MLWINITITYRQGRETFNDLVEKYLLPNVYTRYINVKNIHIFS